MTIAAVVLAAGLSRRMGTPKLVLPWGKTTIIRHVVEVLSESGLDEILVVTGGAHAQVTAALHGTAAQLAFNADFEKGEMLSSIQVGLRCLPEYASAALVCLGDQPQIQAEVVRAVIDLHRTTGKQLVVPSYHNRRGHPWLASHSFWAEVLALPQTTNPRQYINSYTGRIEYVQADESILQDLDTPEDYNNQHP